MDYEQKYKDALCRAKNFYKRWDSIEATDSELVLKEVKAIFPELAESEDERIVKCLLNYFNHVRYNGLDLKGTDVDEVIAWLESQGKQSVEPKWCHHKVDLSDDCSELYRKAYYDGWNNCNMQHSQCNAESDDVVKCLINGMKFFYEDNKEAMWGTEKFSMKVKDILNWLEKQGEQPTDKVEAKFKPGDTMRTWREAANGYTDGMPVVVPIDNEYYHCTNELIAIKDQDNYEFPPINVKQKPADKVEPKFHEGDWIVHGDNILKIKCVGNTYYCYETVDGYVDDMLVSEIDSQFHLWTIQDAKDGDVLCYENKNDCRIFIYKNGHIDYHCCYSNGHLTPVDSFFVVPKHLLCYIHPATKEQRELLFEKMKEADYAWDGEEKELKKIEPKALNSNKAVT